MTEDLTIVPRRINIYKSRMKMSKPKSHRLLGGDWFLAFPLLL